MVIKNRLSLTRKNMTSSPSSSTSSAYASTDEHRQYYSNDKQNFFDSDDIGTTRLLRSYSPHRSKARGFFARLRIDKSYITTRNIVIAGIILTTLILAIIAICTIYGARNVKIPEIPPDPELPLPPSWSKLKTFKHGAVCADGAPCALVGKMILLKNGSAVDATISAMICNGLVNMQSMGIGGGFFMTIYDKASKRAYTLTARDRAPLAANATMYNDKPQEASMFGPLAIAVPGELAGYWEAHKRFGKLPWADLFSPSIEICEKGYNLTKIQHDGFKYNAKNIYKDRVLKELFVDPQTNDFYLPGTIIKPKILCKTLQIIAKKGISEFYNGTLGKFLVQDLQDKGSIITMKDLNSYRVTWDEPLVSNLTNGMKLFTVGLPASGAILTYILNILDRFNFTRDSIADFNRTTLTYHRMIETFKYAYALRNDMGDKEFVDMKELTNNLTSKIHAKKTQMMIDDYRTWNDSAHYGARTISNAKDHGTAHVSVLAPNGDAVSATSTINFYFGSGVVSENTGILLNNAMNDFGIPSTISYFGIPPSPNNYIAPGKRPLSSMVPSILVDSNDDVRMVIGASGGTKITTTVSQIIAKIIWMNQTVKEAVDAPRIHHQLFPPEMNYEYGVPKPVIDNLQKFGHVTSRYRVRGSVACVIFTENNTVYANADYRKGGDVYGLD
ncbi:glutathione hydrolase 1 proenzyme isoform X2 [Apis mellifera]|uniref:Glutathione hydrolase 1 proenzyme isoform X2 n=1 Tax=Apis mellifera TaxID=7460 RepID=A0A7M7IFC8_APIME|nr:glutathione hydrolase 1 proenzyme isoform X2 [Apis mellifera]|eukprot:XP_016766953.1 glutathione hydrolase 1 proenzyme isoform X2 [Apis mellifera]